MKINNIASRKVSSLSEGRAGVCRVEQLEEEFALFHPILVEAAAI
jgi:hypothetical protein